MRARYGVGAWLILQLVSVPAAPAQHQRTNVITYEEIQQATATNVYDVLRELRPRWFPLHPAAPAPNMVSVRDVEANGVGFYVDGIRRSPDQLAEMPVEHVREARFLTRQAASRKYGTGHTHGAVEIVTAR